MYMCVCVCVCVCVSLATQASCKNDPTGKRYVFRPTHTNVTRHTVHVLRNGELHICCIGHCRTPHSKGRVIVNLVLHKTEKHGLWICKK